MDKQVNKPSILAVDDMPENLDVIKGILGDDYSVKAAINGTLALKIAKSLPISLILLDIMMPGMDGHEVCRLLKADPQTKHIPVIFVTTKGEETEEAKGFELGVVDYITKPVSPMILKARVATHLALFDQNQALESKVAKRTIELMQTRMEVVERLGRAAEYRDNETGRHVIRVGKYSKALALGYGLPEDFAELIMQAAPMHDVGKIGIADNILLKPGKLGYEEFEIMKTHAAIGAEILGGSDFPLMKMAHTIALRHHEKWDGSGYPDGLKGEDIPIEGRIVAICDVFDALLSTRPYKVPWPIEKVLDFYNEQSGKHFDPNLIEVFNKISAEFIDIFESNKD